MNPYTDIQNNQEFIIREFDQNVNPLELKWHRDLEDRLIIVLEGSNWYFQADNELPIKLDKDVSIFIGAKKWHRIIKGDNNLKLKINKINNEIN